MSNSTNAPAPNELPSEPFARVTKQDVSRFSPKEISTITKLGINSHWSAKAIDDLAKAIKELSTNFRQQLTDLDTKLDKSLAILDDKVSRLRGDAFGELGNLSGELEALAEAVRHSRSSDSFEYKSDHFTESHKPAAVKMFQFMPPRDKELALVIVTLDQYEQDGGWHGVNLTHILAARSWSAQGVLSKRNFPLPWCDPGWEVRLEDDVLILDASRCGYRRATMGRWLVTGFYRPTR